MENNGQRKMTVEVPCSIGDFAWGIKKFQGDTYRVLEGPVFQMYFGEDMSVCISIRGVCRGHWGEKVFPTRQAAVDALHKMNRRAL